MKERTGRTETAQVNADNVAETTALIQRVKPDLVTNIALPYQDLHIMDACGKPGSTTWIRPTTSRPRRAKFEYKWQWAYQKKFQHRGLMALLGSGFDPGVTNVFPPRKGRNPCAGHHANAGDHGLPFATVNPEINLREVTARGRCKCGEWVETDPLS